MGLFCPGKRWLWGQPKSTLHILMYYALMDLHLEEPERGIGYSCWSCFCLCVGLWAVKTVKTFQSACQLYYADKMMGVQSRKCFLPILGVKP